MSKILLLVSLFLFGCTKNELINDERYQAYVGHWKGKNGTENIDIYCKENGKVSILFSNERGYSFQLQGISSTKEYYDGKYYQSTLFYKFYKKNGRSIQFYKDTVSGEIMTPRRMIMDGQAYTDSHILITLKK